jgi:hypothetical protein
MYDTMGDIPRLKGFTATTLSALVIKMCYNKYGPVGFILRVH